MLNVTLTSELLLTIKGRADSDNGFKEVITNAFNSGYKIGPPADKEYAVEPLDVEIINPSARFR